MAEIDPTELVTIRKSTGEEREVSRLAAPYFTNHGWEQLKSDGSVNPHPATPALKKD